MISASSASPHGAGSARTGGKRPAREPAPAVRIALHPGGSMTHQEARALHSVVLVDLRLATYRLAIVPLADQTSAILVDGTVTEHARQVAFYSAQEWQEREQPLSSRWDLFGRQGIPASLREQWLKQREEGRRA